MAKTSVIGLGFIGLATAVYLASKGHHVVASSNEKEKVEKIKDGEVPFFEPDVKETLRNALDNRRIDVVLGREAAVLNSDITFVTVGTPSKSNGSANLRFIKDTSKEIGKALKKKGSYHLVVIKSTVPPGTTQNIVKPLIEKYSGKQAGVDFGLTMSPEFLREGAALYDVANPDRVVIGEYDKRSGDLLEDFSRELYGSKVPVVRICLASAELSKYASNVFLATKISFINQMAQIAERLEGVDVNDVAKAMGLDPRIGGAFLKAGPGWGGSCFPKDTRSMVYFSKQLGYNAGLTKEVINVNNQQARRIVELAEEEVGDLLGKKVALLGLSFKPDTDDIRDAPSLRIIELLLSKGAKISAYDPAAMENVKRIFGSKIIFAKSATDCLKDADCCLIVTEWAEFQKLKPDTFKSLMHTAVLVDGRKMYDAKEYSKQLKTRAIGFGPIPRKKK